MSSCFQLTSCVCKSCIALLTFPVGAAYRNFGPLWSIASTKGCPTWLNKSGRFKHCDPTRLADFPHMLTLQSIHIHATVFNALIKWDQMQGPCYSQRAKGVEVVFIWCAQSGPLFIRLRNNPSLNIHTIYFIISFYNKHYIVSWFLI